MVYHSNNFNQFLSPLNIKSHFINYFKVLFNILRTCILSKIEFCFWNSFRFVAQLSGKQFSYILYPSPMHRVLHYHFSSRDTLAVVNYSKLAFNCQLSIFYIRIHSWCCICVFLFFLLFCNCPKVLRHKNNVSILMKG